MSAKNPRLRRRLARLLVRVVQWLDPDLVFSPDVSRDNDALRLKLEACEQELAALRRRGV